MEAYLDTTVRTLSRYFSFIGVRLDRMTIGEYMQNHPLKRSIRFVSDLMDEYKIDNMVCRLTCDQLIEIQMPFLVMLRTVEDPIGLIKRTTPDNVTLVTPQGKDILLTWDRFAKIWDGTVLMAEKSEQTPTENRIVYWLKQGFWGLDRTAKYWLGVLAVYFLIWGVIQPAHNDALLSIWSLLIKAAGVVVSLLVVARTHFGSHLAQRFCRVGKHSNCNEVFQADGAKLLGWVSLGELSLAYFAACLIWGVFMTTTPAGVFILFDTLALSMVVYSIVWQIRHKKWCPLCLLIDMILVTGFVSEIFIPILPLQLADIVNFCLFFALILLSIRQITGLAERSRETEILSLKRELLLSSSDIFWHLLWQEPVEDADIDKIVCSNNGLETEHTITVVMNPTCPKCARAHEIIAALGEYRINLVFVVNDGDQHSYHAALTMISAGMNLEWSKVNEIVRTWYEKRELPKSLNIDYHAESALKAHLEYCRKIHIEGTPTVLIDNRRLPNLYDIQDLKILL